MATFGKRSNDKLNPFHGAPILPRQIGERIETEAQRDERIAREWQGLAKTRDVPPQNKAR